MADASLNNWKYYWKAESKNNCPSSTRRWKFNQSEYDFVSVKKQHDDKLTTTAVNGNDKKGQGLLKFPQHITLTDAPFSGVDLPATPHWVYVFDWCAPIPRTRAYIPLELPVRLMTREVLRQVDPHGAPLEPPVLMTVDNLQDFYWDSSHDEEEEEEAMEKD